MLAGGCRADDALLGDRSPYVATLGVSAAGPDTAPEARFDAAGVTLAVGEDVLGLRFAGWGRGRETQPSSGAPIVSDARVEYPYDGVTAWWSATNGRLEQGWTVAEAPAGQGPLTFTVGVDGAGVRIARDSVATLRTAGGANWRVDGLSAWDADGRALTARLEEAPGGFRVVVADVGARYPVVVDPVYTTSTDLVPGYSSYRVTVARAGDVDGDGFADLAVGEIESSASGYPVEVYFGGVSGPSAADMASLPAVVANSYFGSAIDGGGDVNGDGYDDLVVGAYAHNAAYVYYGSPTGPSTVPDATLTYGNSRFGHVVAMPGDVNGDGYDDVAVTATNALALYYGSATGISTTASLPASSSYSIGAAAWVGDIDADGYADLLTCMYTDVQVWVFHGSASGLDSAPRESLYAPGGGSENGWHRPIAGAGDINGDGYADVLVSAYEDISPGVYSGQVYVYYGSASGLDTSRHDSIYGPASASMFGFWLGTAGDVDGDGYDDIVVGAPGEGGDAEGTLRVYRGTAAGIDTTEVVTISGDTVDEYLGFLTSGPGDIDGDGFDDVVAGDLMGRARVFRGHAAVGGDTGAPADTGDADTGAPSDDTGARDSGTSPVDETGPAESGSPTGEDTAGRDTGMRTRGDESKAEGGSGCDAKGGRSGGLLLAVLAAAAGARRRRVAGQTKGTLAS